MTSGYSVVTDTPPAMPTDVPLLKKPYDLIELYRLVREVLGQ